VHLTVLCEVQLLALVLRRQVACWSGDSLGSMNSPRVVGALICPRRGRRLLPVSIYTTVCLLSISSRRWMLETSCCLSPAGRVNCTLPSRAPYRSSVATASRCVHHNALISTETNKTSASSFRERNCLRCSLSLSNTPSCEAHWLVWAAHRCSIKWLVVAVAS